MIEAGGYFCVEHPRNSKAWALRSTELFSRHEGVQRCRVDMCAYPSELDVGPPNQKPTVVMSNAPWMPYILKVCPKNHVRAPPLRGVRAKRAGAYIFGAL